MNFSLGGDFRIRNSSIKFEGVKIKGGNSDWQLKTLFFLEKYSNFTLNVCKYYEKFFISNEIIISFHHYQIIALLPPSFKTLIHLFIYYHPISLIYH